MGAGASGRGAGRTAEVDARIRALEDLVRTQADQIKDLSQAVGCVQRDCRRSVSVLQYNILASYLGRNTQPWFLYGAEISGDDRKRIFDKFYERDPATGMPVNSWPGYVEGILTPQQIAEVEHCDLAFQWDHRKGKLINEIYNHDPDVMSLVELDHYEFFNEKLGDSWDSVFHKRPRAASIDGCGVFWRKTKFELLAMQGFDFIDGSDDKGRQKKDRSCLMVILKWRSVHTEPLVLVCTHLAKNPDDRSQTAVRVRQVTQIMEGLTEFTAKHDAADAPVVLMGDLNAKHFGEIRGIARTVWQMTGSQLHKFLWQASDVPTGPTSITKARHCRIDAVQFLSSQLEVLEVAPMPKLAKGEVIPNEEFPSDHFPVYVRFQIKDSYQMHRELARAWLECVAGQEKMHPLTEPELKDAFQFFDRDCSGSITRHTLEEACLDLHSNFHADVQKFLLDCFPDHEITYQNFIRAYEIRLNHERIRSIGELEYAFEYFAGGDKSIPIARLEEVFREITPISFTDGEVKEMIGRLNIPLGQETVDVRSFCEVVCKASFPHRDRRRGSTMTRAAPHDVRTRASTKELCFKLDKMNECIKKTSSFTTIASDGELDLASDVLAE